MAKNDTPDKKPVVTDESESTVVPVKVTSAPPLSADPETVEAATEETKQAEPKSETDPETDKAIEEIYAEEQAEEPEAEADPEQILPAKKPNFFKRWWKNRLARRLSLAVIFLGLLTAFTVPTSRYFVLNNVGVRSSASITVLDESTQQPLKNVAVKLAGQSATTDKTGKVTFTNLRLGPAQLLIQKRAFAVQEQTVTIGWGSNPLKPLSIKPVGAQYSFVFTDYLSGKPLAKAEASVGEATALSDEKGEVKLTLETKEGQETADVAITADGYRSEKVTLDLNSEEAVKLALVPAKSHVFISKRSGRYDVYKVDIDGKNEEKVLAGSGVEKDDLTLVQHPSKDFAALVSTRENVRDSDGFLLSTLTLIDTKAKTPTKLAQSQRVQLVDWVGDRLVYVQIAAGASGEDPQRHRLMSYDLASGQTKELAAANYFNDVMVVGSTIFYAPSAAYAPDPVAFYKVNADGTGKQTAFNQEVWNVYRADYDKLVLAVGQTWYQYQISTNKATSLSGEPSDLTSRVYTDSPDRTKSLWVDQRDGKGVLLAYDLASKTEKALHEQSGLNNPVQWLNNNAVVFRVTTAGETADYALSLNGGEPKKIKDVTNTSGIDRWYYY